MKRVTAIAPSKCILFGEHAVVYGYPAIAMAISKTSECTIENNDKDEIEIFLKNYDKRFVFMNYNNLIQNFPEQIHAIAFCIMYFHDHYSLDINQIKIQISSNIIKSSGLGSSASIAVALTACMSGFYEIDLKKEEISDIAYQMEKILHGTPSGIDNTTCTYGNLIYFQNNEFEHLRIDKGLNLLVTYTNIPHHTKQVIENLRLANERDPKKIASSFKKIGKITASAKNELLKGRLEKIGLLMNSNHKILAEIGISNQVIDEINTIALNNGAIGSKLTGAGAGGCVISLGDVDDLLNISEILRNKNFPNFITRINNEGVKVEGIW